MSYLDNRIKFWESVLKHTNKTTSKKKAEKRLRLLRDVKVQIDEELKDYYEYQKRALDQFDQITKSILN